MSDDCNVIDFVDKGILVGFFNEGGYILDFSTSKFDKFTQDSVGIPLCSVYGLSKGRSLDRFTREGDVAKVVKLYDDLLRYYEANYQEQIASSDALPRQIQQLRDLLNKYKVGHSEVLATTPAIKRVDYDYIRDMAARANEEIEQGHFDSALTKARTLLEETFCHVLEKQGVAPTDSGDVGKLYNQVKACFNMRQRPALDKRVNGLLSGLEKILTAITEMRNNFSDAHGVGLRRIRISKHHARLFVNAAQTMADFILSVEEEKR